MCAVPNMAVFCSSLTSWFPGMLLTYFLNYYYYYYYYYCCYYHHHYHHHRGYRDYYYYYYYYYVVLLARQAQAQDGQQTSQLIHCTREPKEMVARSVDVMPAVNR